MTTQEIHHLSRVWRAGQKAFNDNLETTPKAPGVPYNHFNRKMPEDLLHGAALVHANEAYEGYASTVATKAAKIRARELTGSERMAALAEIREQKSKVAARVRAGGGIVGALNRAESPKEGAFLKKLAIFYMGDYLT